MSVRESKKDVTKSQRKEGGEKTRRLFEWEQGQLVNLNSGGHGERVQRLREGSPPPRLPSREDTQRLEVKHAEPRCRAEVRGHGLTKGTNSNCREAANEERGVF